jgi:hypothetical protein
MILKTPILLCTILCIANSNLIAQPLVVPAVYSMEEISIRDQADSLKKLFALQGFEMVKESPIAMRSQFEQPIIMSLKEGTWYRFIFIGEKTSKLYEVRMYDWSEKQVIYEKQRVKDLEANVINYDYIPRFTEFHMIKPVQINKYKKDLRGCVLLFKKRIKIS